MYLRRRLQRRRFSAIGMITSMAEECGDPTTKLPKAISLCVPVGGIAGLFFIIPICATMPPLQDILGAPVGQALPYIFGVVMDSPGGGLGLTFLILVITLFCSISITVAASRCTWAFARDKALPLSRLWSKVDTHHGTPIWALSLVRHHFTYRRIRGGPYQRFFVADILFAP
jgi:amino acid transporter